MLGFHPPGSRGRAPHTSTWRKTCGQGCFVGIVPVFLITLASGNDYAAYGILIYGLVVVGSTDNIIRLYVLKKMDNVHPLITLIGVIIGIPLFGFIGLIFGPITISLFFIILKMYKIEYVDKRF